MKRILIGVALLGVLAIGYGIAQAVTSSTTVNGNSLLCNRGSGSTTACPTNTTLTGSQKLTVANQTTSTTMSSTTTTPTTTTTTPTTTTTTTTSSSTTPVGQWIPPQQLRWYWQLASVPATPRANIDVTDFDGFDGSAANVSTYHNAGQKTICYIDVGTAENWRPDYSQFPSGILGNTNGWPGERWINTSPSGPYYSTLQSIMTARFQMCKDKGFDAVEPDNMDGSENSTGFNISNTPNGPCGQVGCQNQYVEWIANTVHSLGMAVFQKNFSDQSSVLQPYFDGALTEQAYQYGDTYTPYVNAGKPWLDAEYQSGIACHSPPQVMQARFSVNLDGSTFVPCW